jgi:hypothetical protein
VIASPHDDASRQCRFNLSITHIVGNPAYWRVLKSLNLDTYSSVLVVSDEHESGNLMASDSHNLNVILVQRNPCSAYMGRGGALAADTRILLRNL